MHNVILLLLLALMGGAGGFFLRRWELATVFEENGLATLWCPASLALIALSVIVALAFILLCRKPKHTPANYNEAFSAQHSWPYLVVMTLAAAMLLIAGVFGLRNGLLYGIGGLLGKLTNAMCILSFFCVLAAAWSNFHDKPLRYSLTLLAPGYTFCLWLVCAYQEQAADPVVLDYVYEILAIICTLLGMYFAAGYSFGRPKGRRCAVFSLLGIYFTLVTLADPHSTTDRLVFLFALLYQLANTSALLYHTFVAYNPTPAPVPDPSNETNNTQEVTPDE